ncbi:hypothetical protein DES39_0533 [Orbus hercynius]|uniref:Uncharacterized protein n=1 Tax=Orbus hercynius TaxID=593135 RepID=A0A495RIE5_9GAMM|nr:hypothetical protein [Orbus hercynius]RKS87313.1 hypothetical protein DES39_0533 [Orbus hercynius]
MLSSELKFYGEMLFGGSWQAQLAEYLRVDRRRVTDWLSRGNVPNFVDNELDDLMKRRLFEIQSAVNIKNGDSDFYEQMSLVCGETHYLPRRIHKEQIKTFLCSLKWSVIKIINSEIKNNQISIDEAIQIAEDEFLSSNDIASAIEAKEIALIDIDIDEVKELRADALVDLKYQIESFFDK